MVFPGNLYNGGQLFSKTPPFPPSLSQKGGWDDNSGALTPLEDGSHALRLVKQKVKGAGDTDYVQGLDLLSPQALY